MPIKPLLTKETKHIVQSLDKDLDATKNALIAALGGDPGHDIGDAGNAMEIILNMITERNFKDAAYMTSMMAHLSGLNTFDAQRTFTMLALLTEENLKSLIKKIYPDEDSLFSGFMDLNS